MRPRLVANLFLLAAFAAGTSTGFAQQQPPRSFPELREIMQSEEPAAPSSAAARARSQSRVTPASLAAPSQGSRPIQQVSGVSEAWPAGANPAPSRLSEPVAAPPATPLPAPAADMTSAPRTVVASPEHTLVVRESIPSAPPVLPQMPPATAWQPRALEISPHPLVLTALDEEPVPAPSTADPVPYPVPSAPSLTPLPEGSVSEDAHWTGPEMVDGSAFEQGPFQDEGAMCGEMGCPTCQGCVDDRCQYRNLFPPDMCQEPDPCGEFLPFGNLGIKAGNERVISGGGFFLPLWQSCDSMLFTDLRGSVDDHNSGDGYFGLGYRTFMDPQWIFGTYIYGDLIATNQKNLFGQAQLGVELLSLNWDFRFNGYVPGTATQSAVTMNGVSNGTVITRNFRERAYSGWDFEVGHRFMYWGWNDQYELRWFLGGYEFGQSSNTFPTFGGPRARLEMRIYDLPWCGQQSRVECGTEFTWDRVRHEQFWGYVRVRIPFGPKQGRPALDPMRRRMVDSPVHRVD